MMSGAEAVKQRSNSQASIYQISRRRDIMEKKNIDWANLGFGYIKTDKRFVANFKDGAWEEGALIEDDKVVISECAGVLQ